MSNPYRHPISTPVPELQGKVSIASKSKERTEAQIDAWNDFVNEHLTDGNGYAAADVWDRCDAAFEAAWPLGAEVALNHALAALANDSPKYDPKEVGSLLMSALGHLENCMANDRIGGVGALAIRRALSVADRELSRLRLLVAPSCAPGEVEQYNAVDALREIDNMPHYWPIREAQKVASRALAALSPQGLDAKEGATSPGASIHSPRPRA